MKLSFLTKGELNGQERLRRLRLLTVSFFFLLLLPVIGAFYLIHGQFEKELITGLEHQTDRVTASINKRLLKRNLLANSIAVENFDYYVHKFNPVTQELTKILSPISDPELYAKRAGLIGYFQIDEAGHFSTPAYPTPLLGSVPNNFLADELQSDVLQRRKLLVDLYHVVQNSDKTKQLLSQNKITFSERFDVITDVANSFIFYRIISVNGANKVQGFVIDQQEYLEHYIPQVLDLYQFSTEIQVSLTEPTTRVLARYLKSTTGQVTQLPLSFEPFDSSESVSLGVGELNWPFRDYLVYYSATNIALTSEGQVSILLMLIMIGALGAGCFGFYRLGVKQLNLAEQRLNFVSSVSHELKTPVTSIRMYAEMLSAGQVLSAEHQTEYFQFITSESERLTRLIDNILQLAKLNQPHQSVKPEYIPLETIVDIIKSKVSSILVEHDFRINIVFDLEAPEQVKLYSDTDVLSQAVINIMDNAVKFFDKGKVQDSSRQVVDFIFSLDKRNPSLLKLSIRDYGLGITTEQQHKLFELFYRGGSELTRSTQGTGIGLALVRELLLAQEGAIEAQRMSPGLAINIYLKYKQIS